jgi:hypothetical protein
MENKKLHMLKKCPHTNQKIKEMRRKNQTKLEALFLLISFLHSSFNG